MTEMQTNTEESHPESIPEREPTSAEIPGALISSAYDAFASGPETLGYCADLVKRITTHLKAVEGERTDATKPIREGVKALDQHFKTISGPLESAKAYVLGQMKIYQDAELARQRQEQEEARKAVEVKALSESAALEAQGQPEEAQEVLQKVVEAPPAIQPTQATVRGENSSAYTVQGKWAFEVENATAVPREFLHINERAVNEAIKNGIRVIEGLRIYQEESTTRVR